MKFLSRLFLIVSFILLLFGAYLIWERNDPNRLKFKNYTGNYEHVAVSNPPTRIVVHSVAIDLPLYPAKIINGNWETTTNGASFLVTSSLPGEKGNSIIYAHNWASLFGNLVGVHPGDTVEVYYENGEKRMFTIAYTSLVSYDDASVLSSSRNSQITLYTCAGFLDSKRFVAVALPKDSTGTNGLQ
jgi:LPXTG-site transpeptidase (sortase) family protein